MVGPPFEGNELPELPQTAVNGALPAVTALLTRGGLEGGRCLRSGCPLAAIGVLYAAG